MMGILLFDFGIVVLIWVTQLIVYPSFTHFETRNLNKWHVLYTKRISIIVMPLMMGQLFLHSYQLMQDITLLQIIAYLCIVLAWINTFFFAVPLHKKISTGVEIEKTAQKLIPVNAWRTACWTITFFIDLYLFVNGTFHL